MSRNATASPPTDSYFDLVSEKDIVAAHTIEASVYAEDEAASLEQFKERQSQAPTLFLGLFIPGQTETSTRVPLGYVCATLTTGPVVTEESMKKHEERGEYVAIHSVAVSKSYQRQGIASALLKEYIDRLRAAQKYKALVLICREKLVPLYSAFGFELKGDSAVTHGAGTWKDMRLELTAPTQESSSSIPPGLLEALRAPRTRPVGTRLGSGIQIDDVVSSGSNKYDLLCPRVGCGSVILKSGVAKLVDKNISDKELIANLSQPGSPLEPLPTDHPSQCWLIGPNQMAFENIGFSRPVNAQQSSRPLKLLSCADCDLGPLGWCFGGDNQFWLVPNRISYRKV